MFTDYWFRKKAPTTEHCVVDKPGNWQWNGKELIESDEEIKVPENEPKEVPAELLPEDWPNGLVITNEPGWFYRGIIQTLSAHAFSTVFDARACGAHGLRELRIASADLRCDRAADDAASPLLGLWGPRDLANHHLHRRCRRQEPVRRPPCHPPRRPPPPVLCCDARTCANVPHFEARCSSSRSPPYADHDTLTLALPGL